MAKNDLGRLGIFSEPGYITINDKYVPKNDGSKYSRFSVHAVTK